MEESPPSQAPAMLNKATKEDDETITVHSNPIRSSKSEYFSGQYRGENMMFSPKSSSQNSSARRSKHKKYVVLDDMTVLEYTSEQ